MNKAKKQTLSIWAIFAMLYFIFSWWHGAFESPLTPAEIDYYAEKISQLSPDRDLSNLKEMLQQDHGGPIFMVNAIKMRDEPLLVNGEKNKATSQEVLNKYGTYVASFLIKRGSYPIYIGMATGQAASTWGIENAEEWSSGIIVRYRSLRTLLELAISPGFRELHDANKIAAIEKTIAYPTRVRLQAGNLPLLVFFILLSFTLAAQLYISTRTAKNSSLR